MSRWRCPLNWHFKQKRLFFVYFITGDAFLNLISFGWFPTYPHIHTHTEKKGQKVFLLLCFVYITSMVHRGWCCVVWGFFPEYMRAANTYQTPFETIFLCNTGKILQRQQQCWLPPDHTSKLWHQPLFTEKTTSKLSFSFSLRSLSVFPEINCLVFLWWDCVPIYNTVESPWQCCQAWVQMYKKPRKGSALRIAMSCSFGCWHNYAQLWQTYLSLKIPTTFRLWSFLVLVLTNLLLCSLLILI